MADNQGALVSHMGSRGWKKNPTKNSRTGHVGAVFSGSVVQNMTGQAIVPCASFHV